MNDLLKIFIDDAKLNISLEMPAAEKRDRLRAQFDELKAKREQSEKYLFDEKNRDPAGTLLVIGDLAYRMQVALKLWNFFADEAFGEI